MIWPSKYNRQPPTIPHRDNRCMRRALPLHAAGRPCHGRLQTGSQSVGLSVSHAQGNRPVQAQHAKRLPLLRTCGHTLATMQAAAAQEGYLL